MAEDYCELCDLPLSTCIHGMPPPPPPPAKPVPAPRVRTSRASAGGAAGRASSRATGAGTGTTATRVPSRVTDQGAYRPHIVRILKDEGQLETEDMLLELEMAMEDQLLERDRQVSPTGEVRWHTSARIERKAMIDEGLMVGGKPGIWELTERGRGTTA